MTHSGILSAVTTPTTTWRKIYTHRTWVKIFVKKDTRRDRFARLNLTSISLQRVRILLDTNFFPVTSQKEDWLHASSFFLFSFFLLLQKEEKQVLWTFGLGFVSSFFPPRKWSTERHFLFQQTIKKTAFPPAEESWSKLLSMATFFFPQEVKKKKTN